MSKKYTYEFIKEYFESQGCELLSNEYLGAHELLDYVCNCGNHSKVSFSNFKNNGTRCNICGHKETNNKLRLSYKYVKEYFESQKCKLLSKEYINSSELLDYVCICGNFASISFEHFKRGQRCMKCSGKMKHSYEYVYNYFKLQGCELLSKKYINNVQLLDYICSCGNISKIIFSSFKQGHRCMECSGNSRYSYEYVYNYFKENGCKLLSEEYINCHLPLKYICNCGNESKISFNNFKSGRRCLNCSEPKGEKRIKQYSKINNIPYDSQYIFNDLLSDLGNPLRFDVPIFWDNEKTQLRMLIEFDGRQHFEWIKGWMTKKEFEKLQYHDQLKDEYCLKNNIKLVRIPYWDFDNIEQILEQHLNLLKVVV